jgi:hypothetical protein
VAPPFACRDKSVSSRQYGSKSSSRFSLTSDRPRLSGFCAKTRGTRTVQPKPVLWVSSCSLQGIAERPLPCKHNVIQLVIALSRRQHGFKSGRGRQFNNLRENIYSLFNNEDRKSWGSVILRIEYEPRRGHPELDAIQRSVCWWRVFAWIRENSTPKRARYLRSRSASFEKVSRVREAPNNLRPASDRERLRLHTSTTIHDKGQLGPIEEVQLFQLPLIKEFVKVGWRR